MHGMVGFEFTSVSVDVYEIVTHSLKLVVFQQFA